MRRFVSIAVLFGLVAAIAGLSAKDKGPKYKNIEVKHFTNSDAVGLPPTFTNGFYDGLRAQLEKEKLADQVVEDGAAVPDADAADSIVIEGKFTSFKPAGRTMGSPGKLGWEINVYRKSDHTLITTDTKGCETMPGWKEAEVEKGTAFYAAYDIKKDLK
jgi:hypothetical protein